MPLREYFNPASHTMSPGVDGADATEWQAVGLDPANIVAHPGDLIALGQPDVVAEEGMVGQERSPLSTVIGRVVMESQVVKILPEGDTDVVRRSDLGMSSEGRLSEEKNKANEFIGLLEQAYLPSEEQDRNVVSVHHLAKELADSPELIGGLTELAELGELSEWDRLRIAVVSDRAVSARAENDFSFEDLFDNEDAVTEAAIEPAAPIVSEEILNLKRLCGGEESADFYHQEIFLKRYATVADEVTVDEARVYDSCRIYHKESHVEPAGIKEVVALLAEASSDVKKVIERNGGNPLTILRSGNMIDEVMKDVAENNRDESLRDIANFLDLDNEQSRSRDAVVALIEKGASIVAVQRLFGNVDNVKKLAEVDGDQAWDIFAKLTKFPEIDFYKGAYANESFTVEQIIFNPSDFAPMADEFADRYEEARELGYSPNMISGALAHNLSVYAQNNMPLGKGIGEVRKMRMAALFDAMEIAGGYGAKLGELMSGSVEGSYGVIDSLQNKILEEGEVKNATKLAADIERAYLAVADLRERAGVHFADIASVLLRQGDPVRIEKNCELIKAILPYADFLQDYGDDMKPVLRGLGLKNILNRRLPEHGSRNEEYKTDLVGSVKNFYNITEELSADSNFKTVLGNYFLFESEAEMQLAVLDVVRSDFVKRNLPDKDFKFELSGVIAEIGYTMGRVSLEKAWEFTQSAKQNGIHDYNYLRNILNSEYACRLAGVDADIFYKVVEQALGRKDKDGNIYDYPTSISSFMKAMGAEEKMDAHQKEILEKNIDWYVSDGLPLAAARIVMDNRAEALQKDVKDTPKSIYEWIYSDTEKLEKFSEKTTQDYVSRLLLGKMPKKLSGEELQSMTERVILAAREFSKTMEDDFRVFVNVHPQTLNVLGEAGARILSTFDLAGARQNFDGVGEYAANYIGRRSGVEVALGIRSLDDTQGHVIYGHAGYIGDGVPGGAIGYGPIMLQLSPQKVSYDDMTFTPEDSFHNATRLTQKDAQAIRIVKSGLGINDTRTDEYVEAQVPSVVTLDDIEAIYVSSAEEKQALPEELQRKTIVRLSTASAPSYSATREKTFIEQLKRDFGLGIDSENTAIGTPVGGDLTGEDLLAVDGSTGGAGIFESVL